MQNHNTTSHVRGGIENNIQCRLRQFSILTGYPVYNLKYLRKTGPPLRATTVPVRGSEVFVHGLPLDALEDEIFWFFQRAGEVYEIRLMLRPSGLANRGYAFVRYFNPRQAQNAIATLTTVEFRPRHKVFVEISFENNRLFLSGMPLNKTKTEIWDELLKMGVQQIVDVIVYRGYQQSHTNRGFVFIEFETHQDAAIAKNEFSELLCLWNRRVVLDWAEPMREVDAAVMAKVTRVFIRNLEVNLKKTELIETLKQVLNFHTVEKVYKKMDYSFIHFFTREMAEKGLKELQEYFWNTDVEVTWCKPPRTPKARVLPPRLQKKKGNNHVKSAERKINEISAEFQNIQFQQTCNKESDNQKNEMLEEFTKKSWVNEKCSCTSEYNKNEYNKNEHTWDLWVEDFDWFYCLTDQHKNRATHSQSKEILNEPRYVHGQFNEKVQGEVQSGGLKHGAYTAYQNSTDEKTYTDFMQAVGSSSFCETENHTLNLGFRLDVYEKHGSKYNAS